MVDQRSYISYEVLFIVGSEEESAVRTEGREERVFFSSGHQHHNHRQVAKSFDISLNNFIYDKIYDMYLHTLVQTP